MSCYQSLTAFLGPKEHLTRQRRGVILDAEVTPVEEKLQCELLNLWAAGQISDYS